MRKKIVWLILVCFMVSSSGLASCASESPTLVSENITDSSAPSTLTPEDTSVAPYLAEPTPAEDPSRLLRQYAEVILGKDNWLFWGGPINELIRFGGLDEAQMEQVVEELSYVKGILKEQGVHFLFVLIPDKELIYPEFMPAVYRESIIPSSYERLSEVLSESGIDFIDCRPLLLEKKKEVGYRLYYLRDTRWNSLGNFYVLQEILDHLSKEYEVPEYELLSVDTDESRICDTANSNDLNDMLETLSPWRERGAPEPVYNISPPSQAPPILWYGSCFSPALIDMLQQGWPNSITHVSFWEGFGLPLSFRQDINRRLHDNKIVVLEIVDHYRQKLSGMLRPEPPDLGLATASKLYSWRASKLPLHWEPIGQCTLEVENEVALVGVPESGFNPAIRTTESLYLDSARRYYLEIKLVSPAFTGMMVDFSRALGRKDVWSDIQGRHVWQGENTVVFEIPEQNRYGSVQNVRIYLVESGVYSISQITIYTKAK